MQKKLPEKKFRQDPDGIDPKASFPRARVWVAQKRSNIAPLGFFDQWRLHSRIKTEENNSEKTPAYICQPIKKMPVKSSSSAEALTGSESAIGEKSVVPETFCDCDWWYLLCQHQDRAKNSEKNSTIRDLLRHMFSGEFQWARLGKTEFELRDNPSMLAVYGIFGLSSLQSNGQNRNGSC